MVSSRSTQSSARLPRLPLRLEGEGGIHCGDRAVRLTGTDHQSRRSSYHEYWKKLSDDREPSTPKHCVSYPVRSAGQYEQMSTSSTQTVA